MNKESKSYIWLDGKFFLEDEVKIGPKTHGLHYGTGAFEGVRVYNGKIFKLEEHINRLFNSAKILSMNIPFIEDQVIEAALEVVKRNDINDGYLRPLIFLGDQRMAIGSENITNIMLSCWPRPSPYCKTLLEKKALRLDISSSIRPPAESFPYEAKASGLYILNHLAKKKALAAGYDDALMLDYRGYVSEATTANFFMVKNGELYTPTTECCLDGITRQIIIKIAKESNIKVIKKHITMEDVFQADEAFLTGTAAEITAITSIAEHEYKNNPISQMLYLKFYQLSRS
jgi:branched-chain amino acid aminotransferase